MPDQPDSGQKMAIVRDREGGICGMWLRQVPDPFDLSVFGYVMIQNSVPTETYVNVMAGNYRVVPNDHDSAGGSFVMFGSALAPGEQPKAPPQIQLHIQSASGLLPGTIKCPKCSQLVDLTKGTIARDDFPDPQSKTVKVEARCSHCGHELFTWVEKNLMPKKRWWQFWK